MCGPKFCSMHITREIERSLGVREPLKKEQREPVGGGLRAAGELLRSRMREGRLPRCN
jgi:hypothetical protein